MQTLSQDLRYSLRMLLKTPGVTLIATLTLALGIGANTAIFSLLDQVMLRRLPVHKPEELVVLRSPGPMRGRVSSDGDNAASFSYPLYKKLREQNQALAGLLARYAIPLSVSAQGQTERARGELVSGNYFEVLGVQPALGRVFTLQDDQLAGAHPVAVLSYNFWKQRFGLNPSILNQTLLVNGHALTVVGVARAGFSGVQIGQTPDIFVPLAMKAKMTPNWDAMDSWRDYWLAVMGRLKPGQTREQAEAAIAPIYRALLEEQLPLMTGWTQETRDRFLNKRLELKPGAQGRTILQNDAGTPLWVLFGMVLLVLLIACTNVANLLFVRGLGRQRELAIRLALGAQRVQLVRQLLVESLLLALAGGVVGLLLGLWVNDALVQLMTGGGLARGLSAELDMRVLLFTFALSLLTGLVFGLIPAWRVTRGDMTPALKDQSSASSASRSQVRLRKGLVAAQVALTMLLLIGAGLFTRTLWNLRKVDLGVQPEQVITFSIAPELNAYSPEKTAGLFDQLTDALRGLPGVQGVGVAEIAVMTGSTTGSNITVEGMTDQPGQDRNISQNRIGPGYFAALGTPLLMGRDFTRADTAQSQKVAIINETFVKRFLPDRNPLGVRYAYGAGNVKPDIEIVGVVKDSKHATVREEIRPFAYQPYTQQPGLGSATFYVRSQQPAAALVPLLRREVQRLDANLPVYELKTVETVIGESLFGDRLVTWLSLCFGALAMLLAGVGLYGVLAYWVVQRTHEIGIRVALGAAPRDIRSLVLGQGVRLTLLGIAIGILAGLALVRLLKSLLYGMGPLDPVSFVVAAVLLSGIALLACWLPARRATKVDPLVALRYE
jgi:putative ABC transport system permease protein